MHVPKGWRGPAARSTSRSATFLRFQIAAGPDEGRLSEIPGRCRRALAIGFSIKELARVFRERDEDGAPCRRVRGIVGDRLARIDDEMAALAALRSELTALLKEWDAKLSITSPRQPAKLLDSLLLSPQDTCTRK